MKLTKIEEMYNDLNKTPEASLSSRELPEDLPVKYKQLIAKTNGGYTEDRYFHFLGISGTKYHNIFEWNKNDGWKQYFGLTDMHFVFAEDIFGNQYFFKRGRRKNAVYVLWISTGATDFMADTFESFVRDIVDDTLEEVMGDLKNLARIFLKHTGTKWKTFCHISHKKPLILSGKDELENAIAQEIIRRRVRIACTKGDGQSPGEL